jgi:protease IV
MKDFFKFFTASVLAIIVTIGLFIGITVAIVVAFASSASDTTTTVEKNSILEIDFDFAMGETSNAGFDPNSFSLYNVVGLDAFRATIEKAKEDKKIKGILLNLSSTPFGFSTVKEARQILADFKTSGKFIIAYSETLSQGAYYMSSVADEIYLYPEANMEFLGLSSEVMFFKNALEKLKVEVQVIRGSNNKFKSAVEPFIYEQMSPENRAQIEQFLKGLWNELLSDISKNRGLTPEKLNYIADNMLAVTPSGALEQNMIDGLLYYDELDALLRKKIDIKEDEDINLVSLKKYQRSSSSIKTTTSKGNVAVIYASGEIISGKGDDQTIGSETLSKAIKEARENKNVKAIVLRINSPGGSALASDIIWRELEITKKEKPIVVSMGDLAASGGYYIACNANRIFAQPTTLTGSIGVFGMIPNMQGMFNEHLGITFDMAKTNKHSMISLFKPLQEDEKLVIQKEVDRIYDSFISKVAVGRNVTKQHVDSIGQGRVWCGTDAITIGLVDELGSLNDAVNYAASLVEIKEDDIKIITYPKRKEDKLQEILMAFEDMDDETQTKMKSTLTKEFLEKAQQLNSINQKDIYQARLMFDITIK